MRCLASLFMLGCLIGSSTSALAQPTAEICNAAFSQGIRDNYQLLTEREQFELYQQRLCSARFQSYESFRSSAAGLELSVPLAEGLLGLGGSSEDRARTFQQNYQTFCTSTFHQSEFRERYQSYISQISSALVAGWNRCIELHLQTWLQSRGVFVEVEPFGALDSFIATVRVRTTEPGNILITALQPEGRVTCTRAGSPVIPGQTQINSLEFTLTCQKHPSLEIPFVVETNRGQTQRVRVPAGTSKIIELEDELEALRSELSRLRDRTGSNEAALTSLRSTYSAAFETEGTTLVLRGDLRAENNAWGTCTWRNVGSDASHFPDRGGWCAEGELLRQLDFDGCGEATNCPVVGRALCCKP
jgi:hypothetical protein